ncbi:MAG TPA: RDD family protein [Oleiagrimonas sp.]|nr:RDD family protein [Oleiagrimonas sp.]
MALTSDWSVTLTGALLPGRDAAGAWAQVAELLQMDAASLQARVPVTLASVDEAEARRQVDGLEACGIVARLLPDAGQPRLWLHRSGPTRGPVSEEYLRAAHDEAVLGDDVQVCVQGQGHWRPLRQFRGVRAPAAAVGYELEDPTNQPPTAPSMSVPLPVQPANPCGDDGKLLTHREMPGLHAGFWARFGAWVIDWMITTVGTYMLMVVAVVIVMIMVPDAIRGDHSTAELIGQLFFLTAAVAAWLYHAFFESSAKQATPGKMAVGLRVTGLAGERIGFGRASGRFFARIVSAMTLGIGYMMAGWTERKQALHGMIAGCCVVHARSLNPPAVRAPRTPPRAEPVATTSTAASRPAPPPRRGLPAWAIVLIVAGCALVPIGILAAIAVPAYQSYVVRTRIVAGMPLADDAKAAVARYALRTGKMPANKRTLGLDGSEAAHGRYVSAVDIRHGKVVLTYAGPDAGKHISGGHLFLTPHRADFGLHWTCRSPDIEDRYLPRQCQEKP